MAWQYTGEGRKCKVLKNDGFGTSYFSNAKTPSRKENSFKNNKLISESYFVRLPALTF
jgi:hypothetical protein